MHMISYEEIIEDFPKEFQLPMMKIVGRLREEVLDTVRASDFNELKEIVTHLGTHVENLAEAQKRTEQRVEELAEAQKRTEQRVEDLAKAQKKTEKRVEELAEAQKKTEKRVEELAEAQKKTEETVREIVVIQGKMRKEIGGLSNSFGYVLENEAIRFLPGLLQRDRGIEIQVMDRRYIVYADGKDDELNIYGEGLLKGEKVYVIGESKSQLGKRDINRFSKLVKRVSTHFQTKVFPVLVTHSVHPDVEVYAKNNIRELEIYKSYEFK